MPLNQGVVVAQKYNVFHLLKPIFEFVAGPSSPPPAPKHTTAASNKPKAPRASGGGRKAARESGSSGAIGLLIIDKRNKVKQNKVKRNKRHLSYKEKRKLRHMTTLANNYTTMIRQTKLRSARDQSLTRTMIIEKRATEDGMELATSTPDRTKNIEYGRISFSTILCC